jgi:hypothetical protein
MRSAWLFVVFLIQIFHSGGQDPADNIDRLVTAIAEYNRILNEDDEHYIMDESKLNKLGIELFFNLTGPMTPLKYFMC